MPTPIARPLGASGPPVSGIIGSSPAMEKVYRTTRRVALSNASVLLVGETGTGKERIAMAIHHLSQRSGGPFVKVNCGALPEGLLESELFGHVRGAFTGAVANRTGRFEAAHRGTIFLDEIDSTSLHLQVKLLRVLQEREFERVGDTQTIHVDTRVIAASNRELMDQVNDERFREDLYYRLNVVPIELPPLRQRREDIPELVTHFLNLYNEASDRYVVHIEHSAMEAMVEYDWPGNCCRVKCASAVPDVKFVFRMPISIPWRMRSCNRASRKRKRTMIVSTKWWFTASNGNSSPRSCRLATTCKPRLLPAWE